MLTRDRPEFAAKAVECFRCQTYAQKILLIWDSGATPLDISFTEEYDCQIWQRTRNAGTIGELRNAAARWICDGPTSAHDPTVFIHWDDDDYSHTNRITEQVALLQASGADAVGYNEMLLWRDCKECREEPLMQRAKLICDEGEAWLYTGTRGGVPALGTSLCYWRKTWERHQFPNETQGVEDHWMREKNIVAPSSLGEPFWHMQENGKPTQPYIFKNRGDEPRMIARIHSGNTSNGYNLEDHVAKGSREWKRVPEWDARVREILA
jgi:hypothetical protein